MTKIPGTLDVAAGYARWAPAYDAAANPTRDAAAAVLRAQNFGRIDRALDLGCGTGGNTAYLASFSATVLALDGSAAMLAVARAKPMPVNVGFAEADIRGPLPVDSSSIDLVAETLVLEHIDALAPVFCEVARVLRPGGIFFLCELHPYRQMEGRQAEVGDQGTIEAYRHRTADYFDAGVAADLICRALLEPEVGTSRPPRILAMRFVKPASPAGL